MIKKIESTKNSFIKNLLLLKEKTKTRKQQNSFVVEGLREIQLAIQGNYTIESILFLSEFYTTNELQNLSTESVELIKVTKNVYSKIAYRGSTEGIIAVLKQKSHQLEKLVFKNENSLVIVIEAPEKPGNIGAILRTADASNVDAVIIANPKTDLYNANIIRSSVGCLFTNTIAVGSTEEVISFLQKKNFNCFSTYLSKDSKDYTKADYTKSTAIIFGTEATGLTEDWLAISQKIMIPMQGKIDSLNVSVSVGVLVFEAVKQRGI